MSVTRGLEGRSESTGVLVGYLQTMALTVSHRVL